MRPNHSNFAIRSTRRVWTGVFALLAALFLASGCASTRQIREIVANSNASALQAALGDLDYPIVYDVDIGHRPPQFTLVNGAVAEVTFCDSGGTVSQAMN